MFSSKKQSNFGIQIFKSSFAIYFSLTELFFSFAKLLNSIALTYFQLFSFLTIFWRLFTEGLVRVSVCLSVSFIEHFITKTMAKLTFSGCWQDFLIYRVKKQIFKILSVKKQTNKKTLNIIHQRTETKTSVLALSSVQIWKRYANLHIFRSIMTGLHIWKWN